MNFLLLQQIIKTSINADMKTSSFFTLTSVSLDTWIRFIFTHFYRNNFSSIDCLTFLNQPDLRMIDGQREGKQSLQMQSPDGQEILGVFCFKIHKITAFLKGWCELSAEVTFRVSVSFCFARK